MRTLTKEPEPVESPTVVVDEIRPPRISLWHRMTYRMRRTWPLLVWLGCIGGAGWLYFAEGAGGGQAMGFAEVAQLRVTPEVSGRLLEVRAEAGQPVTAGDVLARLDSTDHEETIRQAEENVERLRREIESRRAALRQEEIDRQNQAASRRRAHEADTQRIELEIERHRSDQAVDGSELETLETQIKRLRPLVEERLATAERLDEMVLRQAILRKRMAARARSLPRLEARLESWNASRPADVPAVEITSRLLPYEQELKVLELRLADLVRDRVKYVLKAPSEGTVERVDYRSGEWVDAGTEIVTLVAPRPGRMTAYLTDRQVEAIAAGTLALCRPRDRRGVSLEGKVVAVGPGIEPVPERLRFMRTVAPWGRRITIEVNPRADLLPGELYDVRFEP